MIEYGEGVMVYSPLVILGNPTKEIARELRFGDSLGAALPKSWCCPYHSPDKGEIAVVSNSVIQIELCGLTRTVVAKG